VRLEDGTLVEGKVDLAFRDEAKPDIWTVVDFKTDFEIEGRLDEYREQVSLYAMAISRATKLCESFAESRGWRRLGVLHPLRLEKINRRGLLRSGECITNERHISISELQPGEDIWLAVA
jgi:hypothetical protein